MTSSKDRKGATYRIPITRHLIVFVAICLCLLVIAALIGISIAENSESSSALRSEIVSLNELSQGASPEGAEAVARAQESLRSASDSQDTGAYAAIALVAAVAALCLVALAAYLYRALVRPFAKLQGFAEDVASGNLDLPLEYERSNPFGRFAWAFDHMRSELKRSRASERAAIEENKSAIASLAHDLRTPVASIRAYSEALGMGLAESEEERRLYTEVIERRCDEVAQLVDDMLTHSLAELDRISVECAPVPAAPLLGEVADHFGIVGSVSVDADAATLFADELRLRQAIENLLVNASKYASGSRIEITGSLVGDDTYRIDVRDFGPGMADEDIPFAFDRFYRGSNTRDVSGSGLGLYVVRYVVERMGGEASIANAHPGISVRLSMPVEKDRPS